MRNVSKGLLAIFWKAVRGAIEGADHLARVITQMFRSQDELHLAEDSRSVAS
jgi:hypothetical protein